MVANPAAASSDPAIRYPAAKPPTAAMVPHTSASPNRARHACHHPALAGVMQPPGTSPAGKAGADPVATATGAAAVTPCALMLVPLINSVPTTLVPPPC